MLGRMQDLIAWWNDRITRGYSLGGCPRAHIFGSGMAVRQTCRRSFERSMARTSADASLSILVGRIIYLLSSGSASLLALDVLGVPLSSVVATLGIVGIAISLAMQDILKSFFTGLYLLFERPFRIGDEIQLKDFIGRVEHINYRTTVILTADGVRVLIPNATLMSEVVLNRGVAGASERFGPKVCDARHAIVSRLITYVDRIAEQQIDGEPIQLSIVIPAFNEEHGIADILERILAQRLPLREVGAVNLEVIVVDDGSRDATSAEVSRYPAVRLLRHRTNYGYGAALKTGFGAARGEWLAFSMRMGRIPRRRSRISIRGRSSKTPTL